MSGKSCLRSFGGLTVVLLSERHSEIEIRRHGKRDRSRGRDRFIGPGTERVEPPARELSSNRRAPCVFAAIFPPARFRVRNSLAVLNLVLVEPDQVDDGRRQGR
jgi:hypothetical protein